MHKPLKTVAAERTYSLAVKLTAKLSYASCIYPEEAKYHRDCMQWFRSGATVIPSPIKYKHLKKMMDLTTLVISTSPPVII